MHTHVWLHTRLCIRILAHKHTHTYPHTLAIFWGKPGNSWKKKNTHTQKKTPVIQTQSCFHNKGNLKSQIAALSLGEYHQLIVGAYFVISVSITITLDLSHKRRSCYFLQMEHCIKPTRIAPFTQNHFARN